MHVSFRPNRKRRVQASLAWSDLPSPRRFTVVLVTGNMKRGPLQHPPIPYLKLRRPPMSSSSCFLAATALSLSLLIANSLGSRQATADEPRKWPVEFEQGQFHFHCDFQPPNPQQVFNELEQLVSDLTEMLPGIVHTESIHLIIFERRESYQRYMQHYFPVVPLRPAIFLKDRGPGMLFAHWHPAVMTDLRHEVTHALLSRGDRQLPLWLDEGLAKYFEVAQLEQFSGHPYLAKVIAASAAEKPMPAATHESAAGSRYSIEELEKIERLDAFSDKHYVASWMWVHYLLHRHPQTRHLVLDTIRRHAAGEPSLPISRSLIQVVDDPASDLGAHFMQLSTP
jgi:hypothetical protein